MHPALKILVGALMVIVGVYSSLRFWTELLTLLKAGIGPLLVLVGAFIVWLESDELKMRHEERSSEGMQQQFTDAIKSETTGEETAEEPEEQEGHTCGQCGKTFDTERGLHIHQAQKHE